MVDRSLLVEAAALAAGGQQYPAATLYVVATPIGNLADLTLRALHVLGPGRRDRLRGHPPQRGAAAPFRPGQAARRAARTQRARGVGAAAARLGRGERIAYVSDAGTPALSDPGATLVAAARAAGHRVVPIPGPSSALAALAAAGDVGSNGFEFVGFLAPRGAARAQRLATVARAAPTQIVFEAPHRIETLAAELATASPERTTTIFRELTKQFETIATMPARALPAWLGAEPNRARGEFVVVLHALAPAVAEAQSGEHDAILAPLLAALPLKQAVALAAEIGGAPRNLLYARALELKAAARATPDPTSP